MASHEDMLQSRSSSSSLSEATSAVGSRPGIVSKNSVRKLRRLERHGGVDGEKEFWKKKKAEKKERDRQKRQALAEEKARAWAALTDDQREEIKAKTNAVRKEREKEADEFRAKCEANFSCDTTPLLVFDMSFEGVMKLAGKKSTAQQLKYAYSSLRRAAFVLKPALYGFDENSEILKILTKFDGFAKYQPVMSTHHFTEKLTKERIVYLSADSTTVLQQLDSNDVYVIGAFVDHNSKKGATQAAAEGMGLRTARLPLDEHVDVRNICKVLTINHVVDVLVTFATTSDWKLAFQNVLPKRRENAAQRAALDESGSTAEKVE
jgi:tRNA (guanine9-N1)-methyltransferase